MKHWLAYDQTGSIRIKFTGSEPIPDELNGMDYIEGQADSKTQYIVNGGIASRPSMEITYPASVAISETALITGIPEGATLIYPDGEVVVNDGVVEWSSLVTGTFQFSIELFPYISESFSIEVTAA